MLPKSFFFKHEHTPVYVLARLGIYGFFICLLQTFFFSTIYLPWSKPIVIIPFISYAISLAAVYILAAIILAQADATLLNLSLLMADVYAVAFAWLVAKNPPPFLYFLAAACTATGVLRYNLAISNQPTSSPSADPVPSNSDNEHLSILNQDDHETTTINQRLLVRPPLILTDDSLIVISPQHSCST
mmetsp:Transcript_25255/g.31718  ORF Transcript_25255/g.31718 Transcript_25255/m.31718 type:complete len:187 (+) Transcript_25255:520-1080(+)